MTVFFTKVYKAGRDFETFNLIENGYEKDNYLFDYYKTDKKSMKTKKGYKSIVFETVTHNKQSI